METTPTMTIVHFVFLKKYKSINIFELKNIKIPISIMKGKKIYECFDSY